MKNLSILYSYRTRILVSVAGWAILASCSGLQARPGATLDEVPSKGPVGKTIRAHASKFESCAEDSVSIQTGSVQTIQLLFSVDAEGKVVKSSITKMSEPDPDLFQCVLRQLRKITFPKPKDQKTHKLTYPLKLKQS